MVIAGDTRKDAAVGKRYVAHQFSSVGSLRRAIETEVANIFQQAAFLHGMHGLPAAAAISATSNLLKRRRSPTCDCSAINAILPV
jgi:hypothetical protein